MPRIKYSSCYLQSVQLLVFTNPTIADVINQSQVDVWEWCNKIVTCNITWYLNPGREYYYITHFDNQTNQT